ncbi:hypothetical protein J6590_070462 [Homalodisca vitripennis]|nr:hypothetical protein J6590_070462 [Homalodisca vitripennis]
MPMTRRGNIPMRKALCRSCHLGRRETTSVAASSSQSEQERLGEKKTFNIKGAPPTPTANLQ